MTDRKLASIRKVKDVTPIEGADFVVRATIDGWDVVVLKDYVKKGDMCVFFEIDSMLPMTERFEFLGKTTKSVGIEGYRLKTKKIRGVVSQGLVMTLEDLGIQEVPLGADVTEALGVVKYEPLYKLPSANSNSEALTAFPEFLPKTDQERIQNVIHYFESKTEVSFEVTKKLDGSSMTVYNTYTPSKFKLWEWFKDKFIQPSNTFGVCSRNVNLREKKGNAFWDMANSLELREALKGKNLAVQGELVSPKIQDNHEKVSKPEFYVFDIYDITEGRYLLPEERRRVFLRLECECNGDLLHVPVVFKSVQIFRSQQNLSELLNFVEGESINPGTISEGMVFKSISTPQVTFKCVSNKYLLKCEK